MDAGKQLIDAQWFGEGDSRGRLKELRFEAPARPARSSSYPEPPSFQVKSVMLIR